MLPCTDISVKVSKQAAAESTAAANAVYVQDSQQIATQQLYFAKCELLRLSAARGDDWFRVREFETLHADDYIGNQAIWNDDHDPDLLVSDDDAIAFVCTNKGPWDRPDSAHTS